MCLVSTLAAGGPWLAGFMRDRLGGFEAAFWPVRGAGGGGDGWWWLAMQPPRPVQTTSAIAESSRP